MLNSLCIINIIGSLYFTIRTANRQLLRVNLISRFKMAVNIPEELRAFGITSKDFSAKKRDLAKSEEKKVKDNDVIWGLFEDLTKKAASYEMLQMLYWNMAIFKDKLGQNSFEYQQKSHKSRLLDLEQKGKTNVKINGTGCSASCRKIHNLVLPLKKALQNLPVPNPKCEATLYSANTWCTSIYLVAKEKEKESPKLPQAVDNVPELPPLVQNINNNESDPAKETEEPLPRRTKNNTMAWILPSLTLCLGLGLLVFSPLAGVLLAAWSIPFFPPLMSRLRRSVPFLKHRWERHGLLGIGFLLALLLLLLTLLTDRKTNSSKTKSTIPSYEVLFIEDKSSSTRSRLQVSIVAPEALTARDRARVAMNAAKQIQSSQVSEDPDNPQYEYVSVVLEASTKSAGHGYVLAEAEYAPDGRGRQGVMSDDPTNKWKWNVNSSKARVNPDDRNSLQNVKGTLETFLKQ